MSNNRILRLEKLLAEKSHFLLGPRGTGKTTVIVEQLKGKAVLIDLLRAEIYRQLLQYPEQLEEIVCVSLGAMKNKWIVIDEVQKIPELLDEVHRLIEEKKWKFLLTGSSARKLKGYNANLLGGRARRAEMFPFTYPEWKVFDLDRILIYGALPVVIDSKNPSEELYSYTDVYLKEEILQEGLVRKIAPFSRFLTVAALSSGELLNFSKMGSDAQIAPSTVIEHFNVLEDTLIGFRLEPWTKSVKRKAIMTAKFYFFDCGVTNTLAGIKSLDRNSDLYGKRFEQFIINEVRAYNSYHRKHAQLKFWREKHNAEVDLVIDDDVAIEMKATKKVSPSDLKGLLALQQEQVFKKLILVSQDPIERKADGMQLMYIENFLKRLWDGKVF